MVSCEFALLRFVPKLFFGYFVSLGTCRITRILFLIRFCVLLLGVKNVEVDLSNQVVRVLGVSPEKTLTDALEQTGRKARLIGQGVPEGASPAL